VPDQPADNRSAPSGGDELQFERVVTDGASVDNSNAAGVVCAGCHTSIPTEYYDVNGHPVCDRCRRSIQASAAAPRGLAPLLRAGVFGFGAVVAGALVYYAVMAIAHLEIGIIAILIGYMVGYAVRMGTHGRGGRRFQILAVLLTYLSIALAYAPIAIKEIASTTQSKQESAQPATRAPADDTATAPPRPANAFASLVVLAGLLLALPILAIVGSLPSGLISAVIIFIGMRQAWKMTGAPMLLVRGPYRVGAGPEPRTA
jgi:hypothetical protein